MKKKNFLKWLPGIVISLLAVYFVFRVVDVPTLMNAFNMIDIGDIILMIVITIISLGARAVVWMKLLPGVGFLDAFFITNESYLFNNLIPRSGEVIKAILFSEVSDKKVMEVVSSVVVERSLDLVVAATMFLATFPFVSRLESVKPFAIGFLVLFGLFLIFCFFLALKADLVKRFLKSLGKKSVFLREKLNPQIEKVIDGFKVLNNLRQFASVLLWILITWSLWTIILVIGLSSISPDFQFWWAIFTEGVLALGIALPSAPAGLGVYEGAMVVALSAFGVPYESSFGIAIVIHLMQIIITSGFGIAGVLRQGDSISAILSRIRKTKMQPEQTVEKK
jgi:glycosyltransferase 2 family protein